MIIKWQESFLLPYFLTIGFIWSFFWCVCSVQIVSSVRMVFCVCVVRCISYFRKIRSLFSFWPSGVEKNAAHNKPPSVWLPKVEMKRNITEVEDEDEDGRRNGEENPTGNKHHNYNVDFFSQYFFFIFVYCFFAIIHMSFEFVLKTNDDEIKETKRRWNIIFPPYFAIGQALHWNGMHRLLFRFLSVMAICHKKNEQWTSNWIHW